MVMIMSFWDSFCQGWLAGEEKRWLLERVRENGERKKNVWLVSLVGAEGKKKRTH